MSKKDYNNGIWRQGEIVKLFSVISGNSNLKNIREYLKHSLIFKEIGNGNRAYLYDSLSANLVEIVDELKESIGFRYGSDKITEKSICKYNIDRRMNGNVQADLGKSASNFFATIKGGRQFMLGIPVQINDVSKQHLKKKSRKLARRAKKTDKSWPFTKRRLIKQ